MLPQKICFYWAQGETAAPDLVRRCWDAWARMNPTWDVAVFDASDAQGAFAAQSIAHPPRTSQGQADVFRLHWLCETGGVYIDAATVPVRPLSDWIGPLAAEGFFAFHDPYRRRPVENWFLVATPAHPVTEGWMAVTRAYWQRPRRAQTSRRELDPGLKGELSCRLAGLRAALSGSAQAKQVIEPKDRRWSVAPGGGAERPVHPYFWPHYLFAQLLHSDPEVRAAWARTPKLGSYKDLMLRHWKRDYARMSLDDLRTLTAGSRMQKLALNAPLPAPLLDRLLDGGFAEDPRDCL